LLRKLGKIFHYFRRMGKARLAPFGRRVAASRKAKARQKHSVLAALSNLCIRVSRWREGEKKKFRSRAALFVRAPRFAQAVHERPPQK
jgi:hypothetical protein